MASQIRFPSGVTIIVDQGAVEGPPGPELYQVHGALAELRERHAYIPDVDTEVALLVRERVKGVIIGLQKDSEAREGEVY